MFLVELVMQGVRGIRALARLRFQSGFNFVAAGNESGKTSSVDAMLRLLFPSSQPGVTAGLVSRYAPDASRAALVAFSDDGAYYRVIQDFSKRAVNLSRYNKDTKDFSLIYKDWDNTTQFMTGLTAGMSEDEFARLFVLRRDHIAGEGGRSAAPVVQRTVPKNTAGNPGGKFAAQEARLAELREALRLAEEAADADYRLQSAKLTLEDIGKKLEQTDEMNQRGADLDANLAAFAGYEQLPDDIETQLVEHEQRQSQKMSKADELTRDIEDLKLQIEMKPQIRLTSDKLFLLGALIGIGSIAAGLFVLEDQHKHYFPLGVLFSLVLIAIAWYKGSVKNSERKALLKEVEPLEAELLELEKSFEQGGASIAACMKATGSDTAAELKDKVGNYRYFLSLRNDIEEDRRRLLGSATFEDLQAEYVAQQQEVIELEKAALAVSGHAVDAYSLRQDIERLEAEMTGGAADGVGFGAVSDDFVFAAPTPVAAGGGFLEELSIAGRIGGIEMETLVPAVEAAAQRNLAAVTGGKYVRIEVGEDGEPVVHAKDDSLVNSGELSHGTRDLVYFCLRTGLAEALAGKRRLPLILDDPLSGFDPARQQAACQILRVLGAKTQVILFTSNPALKAAGDAAAELK